MAAVSYGSSPALAEQREKSLDYFVGQYRIMLEDNLDDYIRNFDRLLAAPPDAT
jgi:hypothetical protein